MCYNFKIFSPSCFICFVNNSYYHDGWFCRGINGISSSFYAWQLWRHSSVLLLQFKVCTSENINPTFSFCIFSPPLPSHLRGLIIDVVTINAFLDGIMMIMSYYRNLGGNTTLPYQGNVDTLCCIPTSWCYHISWFRCYYSDCWFDVDCSTDFPGNWQHYKIKHVLANCIAIWDREVCYLCKKTFSIWLFFP